ncbi:hypothetical protein EC957_008823 [Mortierella hygrophila]|uniref:Uncharacterized protein n=1 Tax=Mortierella hygrophila TaxID=979708 RepID=A0A9P6K4Y9_9FUNG|nr:hypothetical protein EC957_008823 [Mortierella hygrophila]
MDFHSNYATREMEESRSKRFMEDDTHAAGTNSSSDSTAAETNNNPESCGGDENESDPTPPSSVSSASPQVSVRTTAEEITTKPTSDHKPYPVVGMDEALLTNLGISTRKIDFQTTPTNNSATMTTLTQHLSSPLASPVLILNSINSNSKWDEEDETAVAARRISRRLTMEGRRDGLDILNIAGRLKWPHRSNTGGGGHSALPSMTSISSPSSPLAIKSSQSFPSLALNRAGPGIDAPHVTLTRGGSRGAGSGRKEQLSAISSVLEGDNVVEDHDDESYFSQGQEPLHDLSKRPSSTMTHNDTSNTISSSSNSTIRPPSPSDDSHNTTPTPSHISTELTAMDKIRRQSRDTLTRLHDDGHSAMAAAATAATAITKASTTTGPHSPMLLRRAASMGTKRRDAMDTPEQTPVELRPTSPTAILSPPLSSLR